MALLTKAANGRQDGALAQLVERYTGSVEVRGSTPLGSTIIFAKASAGRPLCASGDFSLPKFRGAERVSAQNATLACYPETSSG